VIYKSIADRLRLRLNSSDYNIGSPLPGEKALAQEFGVARMTIRKALDLLVSWGWLNAARQRHVCRAKTSTMKPPI
jgi:GntR family glv operon transcriptional regulator